MPFELLAPLQLYIINVMRNKVIDKKAFIGDRGTIVAGLVSFRE